MECFADRFKLALEMRGMKQADIVTMTGIGKSSISTYLSGQYEPKQRNVYKIAKALNVDEAWLMGADMPMDRTNVVAIPAARNIEPMPDMVKVPLVGDIACGTPILADENISGYVDMPEAHKGDFALRCKGDSMVGAGISDGDIVYIRQQPSVDNGQIAAVVIDEEATLKRFYRSGNTVQLVAENPSFPPLVYVGEEINQLHIAGLAVAYTHIIK